MPAVAFSAETIKSVGDIKVSYHGEKVPVKNYLGSKATLVVNIGSQCDLPADGEPQCRALGDLYKKHKAQGFQVLAFLSDQFRDVSMLGESEPIDDVTEYLSRQYGWEFPIFDYIDVNGGSTAELYKVMKDIKSISTSDLKKINWNFEKFLLDKDGIPVRRYRPSILPHQLDSDVDSLVTKGVLKSRPKASLNAF